MRLPRPVSTLVGLLAVAALCGCAAPSSPREAPEPKVVNYHAEDEHTAIDEQRVRGQLKRITISPKAEGVAPYEVLPPTDGQDTSKNRDTAGQRVWTVLTF